MKKAVIIYGSATGNTAKVATKISEVLNIPQKEVCNVKDVNPDIVSDYDTLILGTSTWGDGEIEEDWYDMLGALEVLSLEGKKIALFGCGDENMYDTFCDGVGELYKRLQNTGAEFVGAYPAECYSYTHSTAIKDGMAVGLLLDEVNKPELSDRRILDWCKIIRNA